MQSLRPDTIRMCLRSKLMMGMQPVAGEGAGMESPARDGLDWEDEGLAWARAEAMDLMLPTLALSVEWLLELPVEHR